MSTLRTIALGLGLMLAACTPANSVEIDNKVTVIITPRPDKLPFDPRSARLASATDQLRQAAGHHIALDIDAAMVPEFRSTFEEALGKSFETMTVDLVELKKEQPDAFEYGVPRLERVSLRYDATLREDDITFDQASHTINVRGPARSDALVRSGTIYVALANAYGNYARGRFVNVRPEAVAPADRRAYFATLTGGLPGRARSLSDPDIKTAADLAEGPQTRRILDVLKLRSLPGNDPALAEQLEKWVERQIGFFTESYMRRGPLVRQLPAACSFHTAESAIAQWMLTAFRSPGITEAQRLSFEKDVFVSSFNTEKEQQGTRHPAFAWPTIDRFAFGLAVVDEWRKAGHPTQTTSQKITPSQDFVVCAQSVEAHGHLGPHCEYDFYTLALEAPGGPKRLAAALVERNDAIFAATTFAAIRSKADTIGLLRALEPRPVLWNAGMRVFADTIDNSSDRDLLEEAQRIWLQRPEYHPLVLVLLTHLDRYDHGNVPWRDFAESFGSRASRADLESYLAEGSSAMTLLPIAWPALDRGYSRAAAIVPKLDAFLADDGRNDGYVHRGPHETLRGIIGRMCAEKNTADLAAMRAYLLQRVASHPGENFAEIADEARDRRCQPAPPPPPPRNEIRLVPGKKRLQIIQRGAESPADKFL